MIGLIVSAGHSDPPTPRSERPSLPEKPERTERSERSELEAPPAQRPQERGVADIVSRRDRDLRAPYRVGFNMMRTTDHFSTAERVLSDVAAVGGQGPSWAIHTHLGTFRRHMHACIKIVSQGPWQRVQESQQSRQRSRAGSKLVPAR